MELTGPINGELEEMIDWSRTRGSRMGYFAALYGANGDPWQVRTRWYERRKTALLLATGYRFTPRRVMLQVSQQLMKAN